MSYTPKHATLESLVRKKPCWRVRELSTLLGVSPRSLRHWVQTGLVPAGAVRRPSSRLILIETWGVLRLVRRWGRR